MSGLSEPGVWGTVKGYWRSAVAWNGRHPSWGLISAFAAGWLVKAIIF